MGILINRFSYVAPYAQCAFQDIEAIHHGQEKHLSIHRCALRFIVTPKAIQFELLGPLGHDLLLITYKPAILVVSSGAFLCDLQYRRFRPTLDATISPVGNDGLSRCMQIWHATPAQSSSFPCHLYQEICCRITRRGHERR